MATVASSVASITVTPTAADATATIKVNGTVVGLKQRFACHFAFNWAKHCDRNAGITKRLNYSIRMPLQYIKGGVNAALSNLKLSSGTLSPAFAYTTNSYTAGVATAVNSITVTPTTADTNATITVNGTDVASKEASAPINLAFGSNTITVIVTAQNGFTTNTYTVTVTRPAGGLDSYADNTSVNNPAESLKINDDGIRVHPGISPNGDSINDFLQIDNISQYPDNKLMIMNRNGQLVYEAKGYDNSSKVFDGHSNKNGTMQLPGTYFYALDYTVKGVTKHKKGFIILKY